MYKEDYQFHTPDKDTITWRYLDFTKFVDLLTSRQLFFCRSDKFEDPFEGIFKFKDHEQTKEMFSFFPETKKYYFLNCWHMNDHQSDAMWKIFTNTKNGIAIKSNVGRIISSLVGPEDVHIGKIFYRDLTNMTFRQLFEEPQNHISKNHRSTNQFNYKRVSFEHEKELRLYYIDMPIPHAIKDGVPRDPIEFKKISVDLDVLIDEIIIAPFADAWFQDLVSSIIQKLGLNFKVTKSDLYLL